MLESLATIESSEAAFSFKFIPETIILRFGANYNDRIGYFHVENLSDIIAYQ